jgi:dsRNA-specific ribonuclease
MSIFYQENKDNLFSFDSKTQEILKNGKLLSILSHLIPTGQHSFELSEEHGLSHSKTFKINLKISKSVWQTSSSSWTCSLSLNELTNVISTNLEKSESILINETETEYVFTGSGMSKKIAKSNAAQLALENLFGIKLRAPGKF